MLRRAREWFVLTNLGVVVLAGALAAYFFFGVPRLDYAVQIVAVLAMALVVGAVFVVVVGALLTHFALKVRAREPADPLYFEAVSGFANALSMPARRWFPLLEVQWTWESPEGVEVERAQVEGTLLESVESPTRGYARAIRRRFVIEDGFGLARIVLRREEAREVKIVPWTGQLSRSPLLRSLASGDELPHPQGALEGDRVDMRRYVPGDPLRLALWKVYARTRVLMVRTPERAIAPAIRVAAYLVSAYGDEAPAAAARVAVEGGLLGERWVFGADGARRPALTSEEALQQIVASRSVRGTDEGEGAGLSHFLAAASESEPARAVLFVPGREGPWVENVAEAIRRHRGHSSVVLVVDGVTNDDERGPDRLSRLVRVPDDDPSTDETVAPVSSLASIARHLVRAGAEVGAIDRMTGRAIPLGLGGSARASVDAIERSVA